MKRSLCPIIRHKRVTLSSLNIMTGDHGPERVEERTEPCGTPLFGKEAEQGYCNHCRDGWQVDGNKPMFELDPERDTSDDPEETNFAPCDEGEAEAFVVYKRPTPDGECEFVDDFDSREAALAQIVRDSIDWSKLRETA